MKALICKSYPLESRFTVSRPVELTTRGYPSSDDLLNDCFRDKRSPVHRRREAVIEAWGQKGLLVIDLIAAL
jgi:hypothetical protein